MSSLSQSLHLLVMDLGCRLLQCTSVLSHASSLGEPSLGLESTFFSFVASDGEQSISDPLAETCPMTLKLVRRGGAPVYSDWPARG